MRAYSALVPICCITAAGVLASCQDASQSPQMRPEAPVESDPPGSMLRPLDLVYVCGNTFLATNATSSPVQVSYRVAGTPETGGLTLAKVPAKTRVTVRPNCKPRQPEW